MTLEQSPIPAACAKGQEIERRSNLSATDFWKEYAVPNRPVIITDVMSRWEALKKWTPEWFAQEYPDKELKFKYGDVKLTMQEFIPLVMGSRPGNPVPYWTNAPLDEYFPELLADISPLPPYLSPNWAGRNFLHPGVKSSLNRGSKIEIYIGGPGGSFPILHWDGLSTHAWLMQISGLKQYWVWPPEDSDLMYHEEHPWNLSPIGNVENPDLEKYPLFAKARMTTFVLHPGELLFVPSRWWHTAKMLSPSITLSINTLNRSNWGLFDNDMTRRTKGASRLVKGTYLAASRLRNSLMDALGAK